jgi:integrase
MPRRAKGLTAVAVRKAKPGRYFDGDGLVLTVRGPEAKFWSLRYSQGSKLREMGLGPAVGRRAVSLADARRKARDLYDQHKEGHDPLASKAGGKAARANAILAPSFEKVALDYIEAHRSSWTNKVHAEQWLVSLQQYVFPKIGRLPVADIQVVHIVDVLLPLWAEKLPTAMRVRGRIEKVLGRAKALKLREGENPARWRENLDALLPRQSKDQRVQQHHAAMPYSLIGGLMAELRDIERFLRKPLSPRERRRHQQALVAARALEFAVLTCARANEVRGAAWHEIDLAEAVWRVPAERMKTGVEHVVPLSARAVAILRECERRRNGDFVCQIDGEQLPREAMLRLLQRDLKRHDATVHGFRSSFADWRGERTSYPSEVAEAALAHVVSDKTIAAYKRTTFFDRRRQLMDEWAKFCSQPGRTSGNVTPIRKKRDVS